MTDPEAGLSVAEVAERVRAGTVNRSLASTGRSIPEILRANLFTPVNLIMVGLFALVVSAGFLSDGLFVGVVVANVTIGVWQELKTRTELRRLEVLNTAQVRVVRDGKEQAIDSDDIVLDDVMAVGSGDQIAADGRVVVSSGLLVDESLLTGESDSIAKHDGDEVKSGSFVVTGTAKVRAVRVGDESYANELAGEAKQFALVNSELRSGIDKILRALMVIIPIAAGLLWWSLRSFEDRWQEVAQGSVAAAVAMVPDGLVLLTSLAFLAGVLSLTRFNALAKELATVELLARVDTLCLDKTGTITTGDITFDRCAAIGNIDDDQLRAALGAIAHTDPDPNATMQSLQVALDDPSWQRTATQAFSSANKWSASEFGERGSYYFGAPDVLFADRPDLVDQVRTYGSEGYRVLGLAHSEKRVQDRLDDAQVPVALVLMQDTIRPDAREILAFFADQGVDIKVISGDSIDTVGAVAERAGVPHAERRVDARELSDDNGLLADVLDNTTVFGRVTPHQKQAMVAVLQSQGHVVAMTGDGVNDVLALKNADMGIAMGSGSPATRGVAQLVLLDNKFATLPDVLAQGRRVINNIERVANLFVTKATYAVLLTIIVGLQQVPFPFLPRHLTLIGTFSIGLPGFFLALAPSDALVKPGFLQRVLRFSLPAGAIAGFATWLVYFFAERSETTSLQAARSLATVTLLGLGIVVMVVVSRPIRGWKLALAAAMAGGFAALLAIGPMRRFFELEVPTTEWWAIVALAVAVGGAAVALVPSRVASSTTR